MHFKRRFAGFLPKFWLVVIMLVGMFSIGVATLCQAGSLSFSDWAFGVISIVISVVASLCIAGDLQSWRRPKRCPDSTLPSEVVVALDVVVPVVQAELKDPHIGCYDGLNQRIMIHPDQHEVGKHQVLLHEMMHIVNHKLREAGIVQRAPGEHYITNASGALFMMLALSGLWNGVTPEEAEEWFLAERRNEWRGVEDGNENDAEVS